MLFNADAYDAEVLFTQQKEYARKRGTQTCNYCVGEDVTTDDEI